MRKLIEAFSNWFSGQTNALDKRHANVRWEEALDNAILKIENLTNVESDSGKEDLGLILDELKLIQLSTQSMLNEIQYDDNAMAAEAAIEADTENQSTR